jgi:predicted aldo/keto reductase-like oxidoreductase
MSNKIDRRRFLKSSAIGMLGSPFLGNMPLHTLEEKQSAGFPKIKQYRTLGRTGFKASDIGVGTSRVYPTPVISALLDAGVNYIDTAERYGRGASETSIGEAIKGRDRKSLFITSKLGIQKDETKEQIVSRFHKCLERLQTDYIDCIMIHGASEETVKAEGFHQAVKQLKSEGKLRFTGASNHGSRSSSEGADDTMERGLLAAVNDGRFDVILLVYNFLQKEPGEKILAACKEKNIATTIMKSNPIGRYYGMKEQIEQMKQEGKEIDERTKNYFESLQKTAEKSESFIKKYNLQNPSQIRDAALRFVLSNPDAHVLNLAFNTFDDVESMLKVSGSRLEENDKKTLAFYEKGFGGLYCRHACGICETRCPEKVPVNTIMRYNHYFNAHGCEKYAMEKYARLESIKADKCLSCSGQCETACPYNVPIQSLLVMAHHQLSLV